MSNLKFRAWSVQNKQMYYATPFRGYITSNGRWWGLYNGDDVEVASSAIDILMQYTGRKDENGVEVYKGDIVKATCYDGLAATGVVGFRDCSFVISTGYLTIYTWIDYEIEVIGNIYEHPELLKEIEDE